MLSRLMTRREQFVILFLASALVLGSGTLVFSKMRQTETGIIIETETSRAPAASADSKKALLSTAEADHVARSVTEQPPEIVVSVVGAIRRPGVYTLNDGSRVQDIIKQAGGLSARADTIDINLAARLVDGTTLIVPEEGAGPSRNIPAYAVGAEQGNLGGGPASVSGRLINVNRASQAELETLPGIGPKYAAEIIRYRERQLFEAPAELMNVSGIGPKRFEAIRNLITVR